MSSSVDADPPTTEVPSDPAETQPTSAEPPPPASTTDVPPPEETTSAAPPPPETTSSEPPPPPATTSEPPPETTTSEESTSIPPTTSEEPTSSTEPPTTTSAEPTTSEPTTSSEPESTTVTVVSSDSSTSYVTVTSVSSNEPTATIATSTSATATPIGSDGGGKGGLDKGATVAIGVVVPIVSIAILAVIGLFWWKKRRARKQVEEERRKEVEDYSYNPNADPTIPAVGLGGSENAYEMREEESSGYRGWGTTVAGSTGRKASTTMSGGVTGAAYSDATSPTRGNGSEARSGEPLMDGSHSPDGEILGAMGPSAANNRTGDVHRGPSNASSSYSAAGRSEGSDGAGGAYGAGGPYYDQYGQNPYSDNAYNGQRPQEMAGQPVIRDNPARRNTRIENPAHYPQQSAGISQNF